jgi:hypothetical protein
VARKKGETITSAEMSEVNGWLAEAMAWQTGVDWITCSRNVGSWGGEGAEKSDWAAKARHVAASLRDGEYEESPHTVRMYKGFRPCEGLFWGADAAQGELLMASGPLAGALVVEDVRPGNVSRLDVQVTLWGRWGATDFVKSVAVAASTALEGWVGTKPAVSLTTKLNGSGGATCYIGSRKSDTFIRVYDKFAESGDQAYRGAVRFEVELKNERALQAYKQVEGRGTALLESWHIVSMWFERVGIVLPAHAPLAVPYTPNLSRPAPTDESTVNWLSRAVSPSLERLRLSGHTEEALEQMLGLRVGAYRELYAATAAGMRKFEEAERLAGLKPSWYDEGDISEGETY